MTTPPADGIMLIHAFPLDATHVGGPTHDAARCRWRVVAPDLPGFGGEAGVGSTMSMGAAADRCLRAADEAGLERMIVVGLSMGGYVAFELWRMARQRIAGLVLANTRSGADTREAARRHAERSPNGSEAEGNGFLVAEPPPLLSTGASQALWTRVRETIAAQPAALDRGGRSGHGRAEGFHSRPRRDRRARSDRDLRRGHLDPAEVSAPMASHIPGRLARHPRRCGPPLQPGGVRRPSTRHSTGSWPASGTSDRRVPGRPEGTASARTLAG